jgi:hypothetical protein
MQYKYFCTNIKKAKCVSLLWTNGREWWHITFPPSIFDSKYLFGWWNNVNCKTLWLFFPDITVAEVMMFGTILCYFRNETNELLRNKLPHQGAVPRLHVYDNINQTSNNKWNYNHDKSMGYRGSIDGCEVNRSKTISTSVLLTSCPNWDKWIKKL